MNLINKHSFSLILSILLFVLFLVSIIHLNGIYTNIKIQNEYNLKNSVDLKYEILQKELQEIKDDILYLADLYRDFNEDHIEYDLKFQKSIYHFSSRHPLYGQIRFLNLQGKELLRVDNKKGDIFIIPKEKLQDKSNRYYFTNSINLKENEMYLSPFDLNVENKKIETPYNPTLRLVLPIFKNGKKIAYTIINYSGETLLGKLKNIDRYNINTTLINQEGFYLVSEQKEKEWSFMFDAQHNLKKENKELWEFLNNGANNIFIGKQYIYSFKNIFPTNIINSNQNSIQKWTIISYRDKAYLNNQFTDYFKVFLLIASFFILIIILSSYIISKYIKKINQYEIEAEISKKKLAELKRINSLGDMINNIAHQWRQPLSAIRMSANNIQVSIELEEKIEMDELKTTLVSIDEQTQYLTDTINDLNNSFSVTNEKFEEYNLKTIIDASIDKIKDDLDANNIKVITNIQDINIEVKKQQLMQAFFNIFNNAKDALSNNKVAEKYLFINTQLESKNSIIITIKDSGGGTKKDIIDKIFEPYFTTKHKDQGTGISLYLTYQIIVINHNGYIFTKNTEYTFSNKELKGLEFKIQLPLVHEK